MCVTNVRGALLVHHDLLPVVSFLVAQVAVVFHHVFRCYLIASLAIWVVFVLRFETTRHHLCSYNKQHAFHFYTPRSGSSSSDHGDIVSGVHAIEFIMRFLLR